jgi:hypothetical protein
MNERKMTIPSKHADFPAEQDFSGSGLIGLSSL